ncbi:hypothetical protein C9374_009753 [Naegleria lovaniensis]|uniref:Acetyl-CoA hydrolase n=1 Tax=Naegleria lovaniensis TaxID=51637 RepID=A0AA88H5J1_NAELO|nr:uncharacterized protein C9374_009753 [Naegleria lovaniensis]KAG2393176.1 hypothetical protein C9374_009753 [Naegleria lovaniensis]
MKRSITSIKSHHKRVTRNNLAHNANGFLNSVITTTSQIRSLLLSSQNTTKETNIPFQQKLLSVEEALHRNIHEGDRVFLQTGCGVPKYLVKHLKCLITPSKPFQKKIEIVGLHLNYYPNDQPPHLQFEYLPYFHTSSIFMGPHERRALQECHLHASEENAPVDYIPIFLSEAPMLFKSSKYPIDVALIQVSPPDSHGYCSLGPSVDVSVAAVQSARRVVAQINPQCPRTHGDGFVHVNHIDAFVEHSEEISELLLPEEASLSKEEQEANKNIGEFVAKLTPNRACLQLGIGALPNAICSSLIHHQDLGIHSETFSDGILQIIESGAVTNKYKTIHPGHSVCSFVMGSRKLYDFIDDNPEVIFRTADYVNDGTHIRMNSNVVAINSAIEIDITGQVCADSIGTHMYSGVGGQLDFMSSSAKSEGGKPIIAIHSCTKKGDSKIVSTLKQGSGVVTTRAHVHYVCTEYGIAELYGKSMKDRAQELIRVAHPKHRERLVREAREFYGFNLKD